LGHRAALYSSQLTLGELATRAAEGDPKAIEAIKMVKQAGSQGKGGK
jgi:hypothetical protein